MDLRAADVAPGRWRWRSSALEFGFLALAVGAITGRRAIALAVGGSLAVASYVLYALGQIVDAVKPWQPLSPFHQAVADGTARAAVCRRASPGRCWWRWSWWPARSRSSAGVTSARPEPHAAATGTLVTRTHGPRPLGGRPTAVPTFVSRADPSRSPPISVEGVES